MGPGTGSGYSPLNLLFSELGHIGQLGFTNIRSATSDSATAKSKPSKIKLTDFSTFLKPISSASSVETRGRLN